MGNIFETAFMQAPIGMAVVGPDGRAIHVNHALSRITGFTARQLCDQPFSDLTDIHEVEAPNLRALLDGKVRTYQVETRFHHADGHLIWVLLCGSMAHDAEGAPRHVLMQVQDISQSKQHQDVLEQLADHDALTELFNRRHFERALAQQVKAASRYGGGALVLLDLDRFKAVNNQFGHKAGDEVLKKVARELRARVRESDVLARLGGDEFGIILPKANLQQAEIVADAVVKALRHHTTLGERRLAVTTSVGVVLLGELSASESLAAADIAMYEAKESGGDQFALYQMPDHEPERPTSRQAAVTRVQNAIAQDRLELYCQPILELEHNTVSQYELFVRLRTERGELLPPSAFLGVAERFGSILAVDSWVVRQAIKLIAAENGSGNHVTVNVNISTKSLAEPELIDVIEGAIESAGIDAAHLVFELDDTAAAGNLERASAFMTRLRTHGCRFAVDDFGSGFGSFGYLKHLPFDYFTIGREFVSGLGTDLANPLVVDAIIGIARGMGAKTVAEFVADGSILNRLRRSGVDFAQGFHIGVPQPVAATFASMAGRAPL